MSNDAVNEKSKDRQQVAEVRHQIEMERLVPRAYEAIEMILANPRKRPELAFKTARWILENSGAPVYSEKRIDAQINTQINIHQSEKAAQAIQTLIDSVAAITPEMAKKPLSPIGTPSPHIRISGEEK